MPLKVLLALATSLPIRADAASATGSDAADLHDHAPPILVTAFQPFAGRSVNGSATIATALAKDLIDGRPVRTLVMPVRWGEPQADLPAAAVRLRPQLICGLGEGFPGHVAVETLAHNHADPIPDDHGLLPPASWLDPKGPDIRSGTMTVDPVWLTQTTLPVVASADDGGYLCNECFYVASACGAERCGFIHLPPQDAMSDADYLALYLPIVRLLISHNLPRMIQRD
jgi:pyroglutamyl-peptidase